MVSAWRCQGQLRGANTECQRLDVPATPGINLGAVNRNPESPGAVQCLCRDDLIVSQLLGLNLSPFPAGPCPRGHRDILASTWNSCVNSTCGKWREPHQTQALARGALRHFGPFPEPRVGVCVLALLHRLSPLPAAEGGNFMCC